MGKSNQKFALTVVLTLLKLIKRVQHWRSNRPLFTGRLARYS